MTRSIRRRSNLAKGSHNSSHKSPVAASPASRYHSGDCKDLIYALQRIAATMTKPIAIPLFIASAVALYFAIPGLLHPTPLHPTFSYWLAAPAISAVALGVAILANLYLFPRKRMTTREIAGANESQLLPEQLRNEIIGNATVLLAAIAPPAAWLALHLELTPNPAAEIHVAAISLGVLILALIAHLFYRARSIRARSDLRLFLNLSDVSLDEPFEIRVEMDAIKPLRFSEVRARILCFEHSLLHTGRYLQLLVRQRDEIIIELAKNVTVVANERFSRSAEATLDSTQYPPSGKWGITMYPFYHWEIRVEFLGGAPCAATYPLTVQRPTVSAPIWPSSS